MKLPLVAIVGRPNVGKSTLLNVFAGRRVSVVDPTAGVTRDRVTTLVDRGRRVFELMDTGGIGIVDWQELDAHVERQIEAAIRSADVILFVVDAKDGVTAPDRQIARRLRSLDKPIVFAANKAESRASQEGIMDFHELGLGEPLPISAQNRENTLELLERIESELPDEGPDELPEGALRIAIVGRRNAGKSTFVNALAGEERVIVSDKPGTTRDAVDVWLDVRGQTYVLIDTAGVVRRAHQGKDPIQWYSEHRAYRSIRSADVVLLLIDATRDVGTLEHKLAMEINQSHKACVIVVNKWDLVDDVPTSEYEEYFEKALGELHYAPITFISAKERNNLAATMDVCRDLHEQGARKIGTSDINRFVSEALQQRAPRIKSSQRAKVYYATQVTTNPPTVVLFVNDPDLFEPQYRRYMTNRFRRTFGFDEIPVKLDFRRRDRKTLAKLKGGE